ncbi:MAG: flagellar protein FlaG [Treponema sp.]|nr:flagellar protein FlaG [Treponema sp.]
MDMQITNLTAGKSALASLPDQSREKRMPVPAEQNTPRVQAEPPLPGGSRESGSVDARTPSSNIDRISPAFNRRLQFVVDQQSSEITVKVIDNETDTVIKELPPEELQRLGNRGGENMGVLFDRSV